MPQSNWTDREIQKSADDKLNFSQYSRVLSDIARSADTPLTVGVFGPWGSGKTSLMRLVEQDLQTGYKTPFLAWFNAWHYDREEALWRALVIQTLNALRPQISSGEKETADQQKLSERLDELESRLYRSIEREEVGSLSVDWGKIAKGAGLGAAHLSLSLIPLVGNTLSKLSEEAQKQLGGDDLTTLFDAFQRERRKIYREHITSMEQFKRDFEALVKEEVLDHDRRLIIFIDDLDRCLPEKAIEALEALKLFLDVPGCVFFIGVDRQVIQRGIQVKYKGFLIDSDDPEIANRRIPITGDNYLEKIIQLPFHLLPLDENRVERFIREIEKDLPADSADIFAAGLEANPRKIKRALNIFRLLNQLAAVRKNEDPDAFKLKGQPVSINPRLLAKIVVIQSRYRDLYHDLLEYTTLLTELERLFIAELTPTAETGSSDSNAWLDGLSAEEPPQTDAQQPLLDKYRHRRPLQRLLQLEPYFKDLSSAEIALYFYLTHSTDESGRSSDARRADRLSALLSNDPVKIRSAVEAIKSEGSAPDFARRLLGALTQSAPPLTPRQRFSAGTALSLLGDPRNFEEMISIPSGQYPLGDDSRPTRLESFKIAKYPVTRGQYRAFLQANPKYEKPPGWTKNAEWDNLPVTGVSLTDAQEYCKWAAKRLPTAQEWEAAARGPEGRLYPWGNEPDPTRCNAAETRLNGPSPAGVFPQGASVFGLLDMAGNVWEWTETPSDKLPGEELKGGAFDLPAALCNAANSLPAAPSSRQPNTGFRVAERTRQVSRGAGEQGAAQSRNVLSRNCLTAPSGSPDPRHAAQNASPAAHAWSVTPSP